MPEFSDHSDVEMIPVESSNIKAVGYDPLDRTLLVDFHTGGRYAYVEVPERTYTDFMAAESKGKFLNSRIKPSHAFRKLA